ncbi:MAG: hypothetical protein HQK77_17665 [Desulfobacterales bacterium]|nr:hypothetical protein [Desulfobacterales bacterium]
MKYKGVIIEESLGDVDVLKDIVIISTKVEPITESHKTPWLKQWTLHTIEVSEDKAESIADKISKGLEKEHNWYADFKNDTFHYIIYLNKVFKVDLNNPILYKDAKAYGISLGIPEYQVNFAPEDQI